MCTDTHMLPAAWFHTGWLTCELCAGLSSERYSSRELQAVPQDPRFQHLDDDDAAGVAAATGPSKTSPAPSPEPSSPPSPSPCPSPYSSPSLCPSPEPSPPPSPSPCPSPEPSSPPSLPLCSSPPARPRAPSLQHPSLSCRRQAVEPNKPSLVRSHSGANEEHLYPTPPREFEGTLSFFFCCTCALDGNFLTFIPQTLILLFFGYKPAVVCPNFIM